MDAASQGKRRRLWWTAAAVALAAFAVALIFSAYLKPDMVAMFGDVMAFCAALIK